MAPLDKLQMIIEGNIRKRTADRAKSADKASSLCILELDEEITTLRQVLGEIEAIRRNVPRMSDEIVQKRYGQSNT